MHRDESVTFTFACNRCNTLLEASPPASGNRALCPTCGLGFEIPTFDPRTELVGPVTSDPFDPEDPTPLHAYAADGRGAPQIVRTDQDALRIECAQCGRLNEITSATCTGCGTPFTLEAAPLAASRENRGTIALLLGVGSLVSCPLLLPGIFSVVFGISVITRSRDTAQRLLGLAGALLSAVSVLLGLSMYLNNW